MIKRGFQDEMAGNSDQKEKEIIRAIEDNQKEFFKCYARTANGSFRDNKNIFWVKSGIPLHSFNGVYYNDFDTGNIENQITEIKKEFQKEKMPFRWCITPESRPATLADRLMENGFQFAVCMSGMALALDRFQMEVQHIEKLSIKTVSDKTEMSIWTGIALQCFDISLGFVRDCMELFDRLRLDQSCIYYLGFLDDRPVCVALTFRSSTAAGIYWVGTLDGDREKGMATALTLKTLRDAQKMGCTLAVLRASTFSLPVYEKIGFVEHCQFGYYHPV